MPCPRCGRDNPLGARFCGGCGARLEDLHWSDSASEQFLGALIDSVPALRALLVFTYRPGALSRFPHRRHSSLDAPGQSRYFFVTWGGSEPPRRGRLPGVTSTP